MAQDEPRPAIDAGAEAAPAEEQEAVPARRRAPGMALILAVLALCFATAAPVLDSLWQIVVVRLGIADAAPSYDIVWLLLNALAEIKIQFALLGIVVALAALAVGRRTAALIALFTTVINVGAIIQAIDAVPGAPAEAAGRAIRVMTFNIDAFNTQRDATIAAIRAANADIIVLQEAVGDWPRALDALKRDYGYVAPADLAVSQGMMILSRLPIAQVEQFEPASMYYPYLAATVKIQSTSVTVIAFHPPRPLHSGESEGRVASFDSLAQHVRRLKGAVIVAGDLTATPWSRPFADFVHTTGMVKAWSLKPWLNTWPSWLPYLGIPIDQILVNSAVAIADVRLGAASGSDHFPVIATLRLRGE